MLTIRMGDTTFPARFTTAKNMLNTTTTDIFQQYIGLQRSSTSLTRQNSTLAAELTSLKAKLAGIHKQNETYDREFLDRSAGKKNYGIFRRNGIVTLQDWLLFLFFVGYALICVIVIMYYVLNKQITTYYLLMGIVVCTIFGIMMSAVIIRFI